MSHSLSKYGLVGKESPNSYLKAGMCLAVVSNLVFLYGVLISTTLYDFYVAGFGAVSTYLFFLYFKKSYAKKMSPKENERKDNEKRKVLYTDENLPNPKRKLMKATKNANPPTFSSSSIFSPANHNKISFKKSIKAHSSVGSLLAQSTPKLRLALARPRTMGLSGSLAMNLWGYPPPAKPR